MGFVEGEYVDTSEYMLSSIWDLIDAPASLVKNRSWIEYQVRIRLVVTDNLKNFNKQ